MSKNNQIPMEDLDFIKHLENWDFKSVSKDKLKEFKIQSKQIAKNTIARKTRKKALNIRLIEEDITKIKAIALREWLPYQTYLASAIHKMVNN
jgi:predicted DNA binding CopG/RHH family protein